MAVPKKLNVWLCDLTYTQQTISSDVMPAAVGCLATYAERTLGEQIQTEIYKFPEELIAALENGPVPDVLGFSNYCWNEDLSTEIARVVKKKHPEIVSVFGGPNYPESADEQEAFLRRYPQIDFYVYKEGEIAFCNLLEKLILADCVAGEVPNDLESIHRIVADGTFHRGKTAARLRDISDIPSPYLAGKLDRYFNGVMLPIMQTSRGCPFTCTFCIEGSDYFNKVAKTSDRSRVDNELEYIAKLMSEVRKTKGGRADLHISDSNFGMFKEDLDTCRAIARCQEKYGYPQYIVCATGKNQKERILEAASLVNGAIRVSGTIQSLDPTVLANVKRSNINADEIVKLGLAANKMGANSYSDIILGLPGDSTERHFSSIRAVVDAEFNFLSLYQLMMLPGTELASDESVKKWEMIERYRALPRCYGHFDLFGEEINACEIERICVGNSTMSFDDYLECRRMHLVVNIFYNDGVFREALRLVRVSGLPVFEWLKLIFNDQRNARLNALMARFVEETRNELWPDRTEFRRFTRDRESTKKLISGEIGANLLFKYKSLALLDYTNEMRDVAGACLRELFEAYGADPAVRELGDELVMYGHARFTNIFDIESRAPIERSFKFDVVSFVGDEVARDAEAYRLDTPIEYRFAHTDDQLELIADYLKIYGKTLPGLSRILTKVYIRRLYREPTAVRSVAPLRRGDAVEHGQAALTGLNEFN